MSQNTPSVREPEPCPQLRQIRAVFLAHWPRTSRQRAGRQSAGHRASDLTRMPVTGWCCCCWCRCCGTLTGLVCSRRMLHICWAPVRDRKRIMIISAIISFVCHRRSKCTEANREQTRVGEAMANSLHVRPPRLLLKLGDPTHHSDLHGHASRMEPALPSVEMRM